MESIPKELQNVPMPEADVARGIALAKPMNQKVREAADARLQFEDEPASYLSLLNRE